MAFRSLAVAAVVVVLVGVAGCGGQSTSTGDQVDQVVRSFLSATIQEQWQAACAVLTPGQQAALVANSKRGLLTQGASDCTSAMADMASGSLLPRRHADRRRIGS